MVIMYNSICLGMILVLASVVTSQTDYSQYVVRNQKTTPSMPYFTDNLFRTLS